MLTFARSAALGADAMPVVVSNLTPTFWSVCVLILIALGGMIKVWPSLDRQKREGDASLRADLLKMIGDEREQHARELAALRQEMSEERRRCDEEIGRLRAQVEGLQRMIVQFQVSSERPVRIGGEAEKTIGRVADHLRRKEEGE